MSIDIISKNINLCELAQCIKIGGEFMNNAQIAERIKQTAALRDISVMRLLQDCKIRPNLISDMTRRDKTPSIKILFDIAERLNCSIDYLTGRTDCPVVNQPKQAPEAPTSDEKPEGEAIPEKG